MVQLKIIKYCELNNVQKEEVIEIFLEGFGHFMTFSKDKEELKRLLLSAMNPEYTLACVEEDKVLGIIGIATNRIRPIKFEKSVCVELFGRWKGIILCKEMNLIFQSKVVKKDTDLYIDFLTTAKNARGKGIATLLINYSFHLPGYKEYYIEVLSENVNAKRLYEKMNFVAYKKCPHSFIARMGYGYPIKMKRTTNEVR